LFGERYLPAYLDKQRFYKRVYKKSSPILTAVLAILYLAAAVLFLLLLEIFLRRCAHIQAEFPLRASQYTCYKIPVTFGEKLAQAAESLTRDKVMYDSSYFVITYPGGDVPKDRGVCSDVVVRAYRKLGIDLQVEVHKDMEKNWSSYPRLWNINKPDTNIDHRRVFNLMVFFNRQGRKLPISANASDYKPGDIVIWQLNGGRGHIGLVSNRVNKDNTCYLPVHNIGRGQQMEDVLFRWSIIGHFSYEKKPGH
jgi:uncharacterized protein YijF (DUF1287 family)